jgi:hypothetical protein
VILSVAVLILVVVPSLYLILEDFRGLYGIGQGEDVENMTMEPVNETV